MFALESPHARIMPGATVAPECYTSMRLPVQETLHAFVRDFGGEVVSDVIPNVNPRRNADYLFRSRRIVAELKCIERDGFTLQDQRNLTVLLQDLARRGHMPPVLGTTTISLRELPPICQREWLGLLKAIGEPIPGTAGRDPLKNCRLLTRHVDYFEWFVTRPLRCPAPSTFVRSRP